MKITAYTMQTPLCQRQTLALVADVHDRPYGKLFAALQAMQPDAILLAGDLTSQHMERAKYALPFLRDCASLAPCFYSRGNHEWALDAQDIAQVEQTGAHFLENRFVPFNGLCIGGLSSGYRGKKLCRALRHNVPELDWLAEFEAQPGYKLLLCHHPEYYEAYLRGRKIDLIVSGHAHGGQIRLFGRGMYAPGQGLFPRYTAGLHEGRLLISTGLADTGGLVPRLFNETELVKITLEARRG